LSPHQAAEHKEKNTNRTYLFHTIIIGRSGIKIKQIMPENHGNIPQNGEFLHLLSYRVVTLASFSSIIRGLSPLSAIER
jgi:hypothetical protein